MCISPVVVVNDGHGLVSSTMVDDCCATTNTEEDCCNEPTTDTEEEKHCCPCDHHHHTTACYPVFSFVATHHPTLHYYFGDYPQVVSYPRFSTSTYHFYSASHWQPPRSLI